MAFATPDRAAGGVEIGEIQGVSIGVDITFSVVEILQHCRSCLIELEMRSRTNVNSARCRWMQRLAQLVAGGEGRGSVRRKGDGGHWLRSVLNSPLGSSRRRGRMLHGVRVCWISSRIRSRLCPVSSSRRGEFYVIHEGEGRFNIVVHCAASLAVVGRVVATRRKNGHTRAKISLLHIRPLFASAHPPQQQFVPLKRVHRLPGALLSRCLLC